MIVQLVILAAHLIYNVMILLVMITSMLMIAYPYRMDALQQIFAVLIAVIPMLMDCNVIALTHQ
jgi:uncharacterized MnhB-related membrane protein